MIKEKQFKLILREPEHGDKELARGSEKFIEQTRLDLSTTYNPDFLIIEELSEKDSEVDSIEKEMVEEMKLTGKDILVAAISLFASFIILKIYGKRK